MKKKTKAILAGVSVLAVIGVSGIIAYFTDTETVTNNLAMGIVDIDLKEYTLDENGERIAWEDKEAITPGATISKIAEISCVDGAVDCYIRAKVEITAKDQTLNDDSEMLTLEDININEENWYYCQNDGYFYYKKILTDEADPVELFSEVNIPATLGNKWALEQLSIDVTAEAIQSENFTPSFLDGTTEPWPGITEADIEECIYPSHIKYE